MLFELVHGSGGEYCMGSGVGKSLCDRQANAATGAGDQGCLAGKGEDVVHDSSVVIL
jgi:hypothetical protein